MTRGIPGCLGLRQGSTRPHCQPQTPPLQPPQALAPPTHSGGRPAEMAACPQWTCPPHPAQTNENISPGVVLTVAKELRKLTTQPLDGIKVLLNEDDVTDVSAELKGPGQRCPRHPVAALSHVLCSMWVYVGGCMLVGESGGCICWVHLSPAHSPRPARLSTPRARPSRAPRACSDLALTSPLAAATPFESGVYKVKLSLPSDFPHAPPKGFFLTKIYHPNVSKSGEICVNTLKKDWRSDLGIGHVLQVIRCLLINPFPESALNDEAGKLFMEDYDEYFRKAQMMTEVHAQPAASKDAAASAAAAAKDAAEGGTVEKRQTLVDKAAEKRRLEKKKSLKRL